MITAEIEVIFDTEWLVAGGESLLGTADIAPMKDDEGFPFIPGRSLRGVVREAVCLVDDCINGSWERTLFGERLVPGGPHHYREGTVRVGNALLVRELATACNLPDVRQDIFATVRRTALTMDRVAQRHTLRELEVCIPGLVLMAELQVADERSLHVIAFACGLVRSIGHGRSRGLGRCRLEVRLNGHPVQVREIPLASDGDEPT
jgi:CRISPR/Cas system CSM-associated protein Csm3 (group 7 of RAMP superfamily)